LNKGLIKSDDLAIIHKLWFAKKLEFLLAPSQRPLYQHMIKPKSEIVVATTSRQVGKTTTAIVAAIKYALEKPKSNILYGSPTRDMTKTMVFPTLRKLIETAPDGCKPRHNRDNWIFPNGSIIRIVGVNVDDGNRLRGNAADLVILDECRDMPKLQYIMSDIILPMFNTTKGHAILVSTPPASPGHPFTKIYIEQAIRNNSFYKATWEMSHSMTQEIIDERAKSMPGGKDSQAFKREYLADYTCIDKNRAILPSFSRKTQLEFLAEHNPDCTLIQPWIGIDLGSRDRTAIIFAEYDSLSNVLIAKAECYLSNPTQRQIANAILYGEMELWKGKFYPEPKRVSDVDPMFINDMRREYQITILQTKRGQDKVSMINKLDHSIFVQRTVVDPIGCKNLTNEMETGVWNENRNDYVRDKESGSHLDGVDALKMIELALSRKNNHQAQEPTNLWGIGGYTHLPNYNRPAKNPFQVGLKAILHK